MTGTAEERGWGPGWQTDRRADMAKVTAGDVSVWVHKEIAPAVGWLMAATVQLGYPLKNGQCWGYACRAIRNSNKPSNHSWGLAVDINAPSNPMGDKLITDMPKWMTDMWKTFGFRWGGDYAGRKDAMHFEYMGTVDEARKLAAAVPGQPAPQVPAPVAEGTLAFPGGVFKLKSRGEAVRQIQTKLGIGADGDFGPATQRAVKAFQQTKGLPADGIVGPQTWAALFG
jgi:hypothetical protein